MPSARTEPSAHAVLPAALRRRLRHAWHRWSQRPPVGHVRFGDLRRVAPVSRDFGLTRGQAVDRFYIERFLARHAADIRGVVLEIGEATYTRRFGGGAVARSDVLHLKPGNPEATIAGDLTDLATLPADTFDCIILTQTLQFIFDPRAALRTVRRGLKPGGVLLATFPGISQISRYDMDRWGDYWRVTSLSARRLFETTFPPGRVSVEAHGNVLAAAAFLYGLAVEDLRPEELEADDPDYEMLITVRAVKEPAGP
jgi:SAM-dependent methyltransferase